MAKEEHTARAPILGTHRIVVQTVRVRVEVVSETLMVPPFELDIPAEVAAQMAAGDDDAERRYVLAELRRRTPGLRFEVVQ